MSAHSDSRRSSSSQRMTAIRLSAENSRTRKPSDGEWRKCLPYKTFRGCCGARRILASSRRFRAVAARGGNSSFAPRRPRNRSLFRPRILFRCAKSRRRCTRSGIPDAGRTSPARARMVLVEPTSACRIDRVTPWTASCLRGQPSNGLSYCPSASATSGGGSRPAADLHISARSGRPGRSEPSSPRSGRCRAEPLGALRRQQLFQ